MPGNIAYANPVWILPQTLCRAFTEARRFEQLQNTYHDGTRHASKLADTSRRVFVLSKRLDAEQLDALKSFWDTVGGPLFPFYFYNPFEGTPPGSNFDYHGESTVGRIVVVFRGDWSQSTTMQRTDIPNIQMEEVA
jgi:hypothetical protein